ncbi:hypothetical protein [Rheinheimera sp. NSM]|uniref:hypothetical protein n=1 Tax=Rheinheimera sp. NSM TaxID=3457884 RepID=UPI0040359271
MNKNQSNKGSSNDDKRQGREVAEKVTDDKKVPKKDRTEKNDGRNGAVLGEINDPTGKKNK